MSDFMAWVTHGVKRGRFESSSRAALSLFAFVAALALLTALYLLLVSRTAARGRHIEELQAELFELQRGNERLAVAIAEESMVPRLAERATALGFVPAEEVEFMSYSQDP